MSMMDSRLKPSTPSPPESRSVHVPGSSGPRWRIRCDAPATASTISADGAAEESACAGSATKASSPHTAPVCRTVGSSPGRRFGRSRYWRRCVELGTRLWSTLRSIRPSSVTPRRRLVTPRGLGPSRRRSRRMSVVALAATLGGAALLLSGCSWSEVVALGWPEGITPQAHLNRELWIGSLIAALVVGVIVWGLIFWASAFHRHKKTDTELPRQFGYNMPLELVLTVTPFLIISVLFYFTVVVQERMLHKDPNPEVVIDVTAFQWNWKFGYQKINFKDGTLSYDGGDDGDKAGRRGQPRGGVGRRGPRPQPRGPALPELRQGRDAGQLHRDSDF